MIQLPTEPKIINKEKNKATFEISPLYPGYGVTIGNVLRRVLLSSLPGAAITSAQISGAEHEFTSLPNVLESVIDIILNLKSVRLKSHLEEPVKITISEKGEKEVKAGDIKITPDIEIINKDQLIATLTDSKAELEMELTVEKGTGYVPVEQKQQKEKVPIGTIALDANFNPVRRVNFKTENIRVGQRTDFNKLIMEVETDGSLLPAEALKQASEILNNHFDSIKNLELPKIKKEIKIEEEKKNQKKTKKNEETQEG